MNYVSNYSYGLAVSACLYRVLDNGTDFNQENIGGCTLLLPCWAWDRIKFLSPSIEPLFTKDIVVGLGFPLEKRLIFYLYSYFLNLKFECILTFVVQIKHILFMKVVSCNDVKATQSYKYKQSIMEDVGPIIVQ